MTAKWIKDTGLVMALVCLILGFKGDKVFLYISGILLLISIIAPVVLYPIGYIWLKLVHILNLIVPKIFFGSVFFLVISPIGFIRRFAKRDNLFIYSWKKVPTSFIDRNHKFSRLDLETPY
jgi:hypothetical protein